MPTVSTARNESVQKEVDRLVLALDRMDHGDWSRMVNNIIDSKSKEDANNLARQLCISLFGSLSQQAAEFGAKATEFKNAGRREASENEGDTRGHPGAVALMGNAQRLAARGWSMVKEAVAAMRVGETQGGFVSFVVKVRLLLSARATLSYSALTIFQQDDGSRWYQ